MTGKQYYFSGDGYTRYNRSYGLSEISPNFFNLFKRTPGRNPGTQNMKVSVTYIPNPDYTPPGEYKRTSLDDRKDAADFLIKSCDGGRRIIEAKTFTLQEGRSIKRYSNGYYSVTEKVCESLKGKCTYECDF
jgi:hypothetical protein